MELDEYIKIETQKLGARLRQLRMEAGYTNAEKFAYEHDIARSQYSKYERGEDLRFSSLVKLIHAHKMTITEFFSEGFD